MLYNLLLILQISINKKKNKFVTCVINGNQLFLNIYFYI